MPRPQPPLSFTMETIDREANPEEFENALRILARMMVREYRRRHTTAVPQAPKPALQSGVEDADVAGRKLLDIEGLSRYLSIPKATLYSWVCSRKLPPQAVVRLGRSLRFERAEIDAWVEQQRASRS